MYFLNSMLRNERIFKYKIQQDFFNYRRGYAYSKGGGMSNLE